MVQPNINSSICRFAGRRPYDSLSLRSINIVYVNCKWRNCAAAMIKWPLSASCVAEGSRAYHVCGLSLLLEVCIFPKINRTRKRSWHVAAELRNLPVWYVMPNKPAVCASLALTFDWLAVNRSWTTDRIERNSACQRASEIVCCTPTRNTSTRIILTLTDIISEISLSLRCSPCVSTPGLHGHINVKMRISYRENTLKETGCKRSYWMGFLNVGYVIS